MPAGLPPLKRLDCLPKTGWWRLRHRLMDPEDRRTRFRHLATAPNLELAERLSKMRTLIDLGLWSDIDDSSTGWLASLFGGTSLRKLVLGYEQGERRSLGFAAQELINTNAPAPAFQMLVEAGLDLEDELLAEHFDTPLLMAIRKGRHQHVEILLRAGANAGPTAKHSPLVMAINNFNRAKSVRPHANEILDHVLLAGADPNQSGGSEYNEVSLPLFAAAATLHPPVVDRLLEAGATIPDKASSSRDLIEHVLSQSMSSDWTPEMEVSFRSIVSSLKLYGLDTSQGAPLLRALSGRYHRAADVLVDMGADINAYDGQGATVAHLLVINFNPSDAICEKLLDRIDFDAWSKTDRANKTPRDVLSDRIEDAAQYGFEDQGCVEWQAFLSSRSLQEKTPAAHKNSARPRL